MSATVRHNPDDPDCHPRSFGQRVGLLLILLILPVTAVSIPTLFVTGFFGQRPKPKPTRPPAKVHLPQETKETLDGLNAALDRSAQSLLPPPAPLTPEPIRLTVRLSRLAAKAEKVAAQAKALGGSTVEGVSDPGEKHLYIELPAGRTAFFRSAVVGNVLPATPTTSQATGAAHDQVEVILHGDEDE